MQRTFSKVSIAGAAFVAIAGLTMVIRGDVALRQRTGFPQDWSHSHLIFYNPGSFAQAVRNGSVAHWYKIINDPRYQMQQLRRNATAMQRNVAMLKPTPPKPTPPKLAPPKSAPVAKDWNFSLQTTGEYEGVIAQRYPAKYSFNETGANCANDFVIYGLYVPGASNQANLVGVNNLYVGASEGGGCGTPSGSNGGSGSAPTPQVKWAFNVATGGQISSSVVLSLDGTKVAYVLGTTNPAVLQVLTLPSAQSGTITSPTSTFGACNTTAPSICSVTLTSSGLDSNSFPYVDYATDTGYVGDDTGHLYKITNFFSVNGTAPALAGSPWPVTTDSGYAESSPVYDGNTGTVFIGCYDGGVYGFNTTTGVKITNSPIALAVAGTTNSGGATSRGLWAAPVIVDPTNHLFYAFYGDGLDGNAEVAQVVYYDHTAAKVEFVSGGAGTPGSTSTAVAGTNRAAYSNASAGTYVITQGAFSESYFSNGPSTTSFLYGTGPIDTTTPGVGVHQFSFNASGQLQGPSAMVQGIDSTLHFSDVTNWQGFICWPMTEFYNTNGTPTDYLFVSCPAPNQLVSLNITNNNSNSGGTPPYGVTGYTYVNTLNGGTSGIIVDGQDTTTNAASLYFTTEESGTCTTSSTASPANNRIGSASPAICAFKLTQSGLQ